jgi:hypothetical protein
MGMDLTEWFRWSSWCWLVIAGLAIALWALWADRPHGRRRCPQCWYDLGGTDSRRCSECGHETATERGLHRTRRHWRLAMAGALFLGSGVAAPVVANVGSGWPRYMPTTVLVLGVSVIEDTHWQVAWKRDLLDELLRRHMGVGAPRSGTGRALKDWQWRLLVTRAMRRVPPSPGLRMRNSRWGMVLEAGLSQGAIDRIGLIEEFMERYRAHMVVEVPLRLPDCETVPVEIVAETPFGRRPLRIRSVTADGEPLAWEPAEGGSQRGGSGSRGVVRIPDDRTDIELRFHVEMVVPVQDGKTGDRIVGVRVRPAGSLCLYVAGPLSDSDLDEFVLRRLNSQQLSQTRQPPARPKFVGRLPDELEVELQDHEIAAMSLSAAKQRYAAISSALQKCRLDAWSKERLWREWRRVRDRVRELKKQGCC